MGIVQNKDSFLANCRKFAAADGNSKIEQLALNKIKLICHTMEEQILSRTPVYTGSVIRNFTWSVGSPQTEHLEPIDNGPTGHTNNMPLGSEPRRSPNAQASRETLERLVLKLGVPVFLTNNDPDFHGVEAGVFPPPPLRQRSSAMVARALSYVRSRFGV